ncbi:hypothetical protein [uncultured Vagococcus sp.]|uniref:hypothetical protein n=1 Tax=uncultured Vagococcus sp. TaxID=189676 RepID=UPI0025844B1D|nr:hypothetical protein [uncultured Vagococcus sp.]
MTNETLIHLMSKIGSDKTYLTDGYYRIRDNKSGQKELAFLKPDGCGTTSVNPQITVEEVDGNWLAVKLMDMGNNLTKFIIRDDATKEELDNELEKLIKKMEEAIQ